METIKAPPGFEGLRCFNDGCREWEAFARPIGTGYFTRCGLVGHSRLTKAELDANAEAAIAKYVALGMVK